MGAQSQTWQVRRGVDELAALLVELERAQQRRVQHDRRAGLARCLPDTRSGTARATGAARPAGPAQATPPPIMSPQRPDARRTARRGPATAASRPHRAGVSRAPSFLDRPERIAFEVDDPIAVIRDEDLAEVIVGMDPGQQRKRRRRLEGFERLGDPRRQVAKERGRVARDDLGGAGQSSASGSGPRLELRPGRVPWFQVGHALRARQRRRAGPAVSVPRSAAISVANSTLTSPGARIHAARPRRWTRTRRRRRG